LFRFILLSGDYHVSTVTQLALQYGNGVERRIVGVSIVAPPVYAPMPYINAAPSSVDVSETVKIKMARGRSATWSLATVESMPEPKSGSAIAQLIVNRSVDPHYLYEVTYQASLMNYGENDSPRRSVATVRFSKAPEFSGIQSTVEDMTASKEPTLQH
jgi:hypothetical protein